MPYLQTKTLHLYGLKVVSILFEKSEYQAFFWILYHAGIIICEIFYIFTFIYFEILFYLLKSISYMEFLSGFFIYRGNTNVRSRNHGTS